MVRMYGIALLLAVTGLSIGLPASAQTEERRSYIGVGGNIGLSGEESSLGEGGFSIVSRTRIVNYLSLRNSTIFGEDSASVFALTGELPLTNAAGETVATPFLGGGLWFHGEVDPVLSAGVDVPLGRDFTITNRVNVGFDSEETDIGLLIGIGYNFNLF